MKIETFFEKFELFADAPNADRKMREMVLRLAFAGGLSDNRPGQCGATFGMGGADNSITMFLDYPDLLVGGHRVENGHVHLRTHNISKLGTLNFDLRYEFDPMMINPQESSIRYGDILFDNTNSQELVGKTCLVDQNYNYGFSNHITRLRLKDDVFSGFVVFYLTLSAIVVILQNCARDRLIKLR